MDKSQKVVSSVPFLIMAQILIDLISQGIHTKQDKEFPDLAWTKKSKTKSFLLPGTNKKLDLHLQILFNLIIFVHPRVQPTEHSSNIKLHNTSINVFIIIKMAIITDM